MTNSKVSLNTFIAFNISPHGYRKMMSFNKVSLNLLAHFVFSFTHLTSYIGKVLLGISKFIEFSYCDRFTVFYAIMRHTKSVHRFIHQSHLGGNQ